MDEVERQFFTGVAKQASDLSRRMTDGQSSKFTGFKDDRTNQILRQVVRENKGRGDVMGSPVTSPDNFESVTLEPLKITPDMIKEIAELEGDNILPEYYNRGNVMGNPQQQVRPIQPQGQLPQYPNYDPNQMEMNFDKITADTVYEQYQEVKKELTLLRKDITVIKSLIETLINEDE